VISCRKCGTPCRKGNRGLCAECLKAYHAAGNGSTEYRKNSDAVRDATNRLLDIGARVFCGICRQDLQAGMPFHIDHIIPLREGGSNAAHNLRPTHPRCNMSDH
jgi:5-methylcytosine-specific restriction endonuclease McrA